MDCEDLDEQKFSYMMVHTFHRSAAHRDQILGVFKAMKESRIESAEAKKCILAIFKRSKSMQATKDFLMELQVSIEKEMKALDEYFGDENSMLHLVLEMLKV